uniref:Ig-like domain-containing protein n=1 Tax=Salmo trutta TaxID=8032 RepID=A0A674F482_SALTR
MKYNKCILPSNPPSFMKVPKPVEVIKGKDAMLYCELYGTEPFKIIWYKDKKPLKESRKYKMVNESSSATLHILAVDPSDVGEYECRVTNKVGYETFKPEAAPAAPAPAKTPTKRLDNLFFVDEPQSVNVTEKGTATFIAKVGGDPIPNVKWMKGKWRQITHGGRITIEQKGPDAKLEITEITKSDSGQYRCVATNKAGEIECSTDLNVDERKDIGGVDGDFRTLEIILTTIYIPLFTHRTPSKQKSPKKEGEIDLVEILRGVDPKDYEKVVREYGITDYRCLLQAIEQLKREKEAESGKLVR